jgi:secreted trypsin-like serine protease
MKTLTLIALAAASALSLAAVACTASSSDDEAVESSNASIVGGTEADEGEWPGAVALYKNSSRPVCGGSLIADSWVLTAGHCVSVSSPTGGVSSVAIGRHKLSVTTVGETRTVDRAIRHAGYANLNNDIALLHLTTPASASFPRAKILSSADIAAVITGADTVVVGWGRTAESGGASADALREVTVPIIANNVCKTYPRYENVTDNMICAGFTTGQYDSCQGDSGGPLYMTIAGEKKQIGLVSWGIGCARPNAPGVYTRISNYLAWLYEKTEGAAGEIPSSADGGAGDASTSTDAATPPPDASLAD